MVKSAVIDPKAGRTEVTTKEGMNAKPANTKEEKQLFFEGIRSSVLLQPFSDKISHHEYLTLRNLVAVKLSGLGYHLVEVTFKNRSPTSRRRRATIASPPSARTCRSACSRARRSPPPTC